MINNIKKSQIGQSIQSVITTPIAKSSLTTPGEYIFTIAPSDGFPAGVSVNGRAYTDGANNWLAGTQSANAVNVVNDATGMLWFFLNNSWISANDLGSQFVPRVYGQLWAENVSGVLTLYCDYAATIGDYLVVTGTNSTNGSSYKIGEIYKVLSVPVLISGNLYKFNAETDVTLFQNYANLVDKIMVLNRNLTNDLMTYANLTSVQGYESNYIYKFNSNNTWDREPIKVYSGFGCLKVSSGSLYGTTFGQSVSGFEKFYCSAGGTVTSATGATYTFVIGEIYELRNLVLNFSNLVDPAAFQKVNININDILVVGPNNLTLGSDTPLNNGLYSQNALNSWLINSDGSKQNIIKTSVANQAAMLALTGLSQWDIVVRTDLGNSQFQLTALPATNLANWRQLSISTPTPVISTTVDQVINGGTSMPTVDGLYAIKVAPSSGLPVGSVGDILKRTSGVWTIDTTWASAGASIYNLADQKVYNKANVGFNTWNVSVAPLVYEVISTGNNTKAGGYTTVQNAMNAYEADYTAGLGVIGVIHLNDTNMSETPIWNPSNANCQNLTIIGVGDKYRSFTQITQITLGANAHRVTLSRILGSTSGVLAPFVIQSRGTINESGANDIPRGKIIFDNCTLSTNGNVGVDIQSCDNFIVFNQCDLGNKIVNYSDITVDNTKTAAQIQAQATTYTGILYKSTDTNRYYKANGTAWQIYNANFALPLTMYLDNTQNLALYAGLNRLVTKQSCATVIEISNNNNVLEYGYVVGVLANDAAYDAVIALGAAANGYYLANYTRTKTVSSVNAASNTLGITGHGTSTGDLASFSGTTLPAPIIANKKYAVVKIDANNISLIDPVLSGTPAIVDITGTTVTAGVCTIFSAGSVLLRLSPNTTVDRQHYNASNIYYDAIAQKSYSKKAGIFVEINASDPLKADKIPNVLAVANLSTGGNIGTAAATVDSYEKFDLTQTTAGQTITLPAPTSATNKKIVYIENKGTVPFTIYGVALAANTFISAIWDGTQWAIASGGGSGAISIQKQIIAEAQFTALIADNNTATDGNYILNKNISAWVASTAYIIGNLVINSGVLYRCKTAHTSGTSFSITNWDSFNFLPGDIFTKTSGVTVPTLTLKLSYNNTQTPVSVFDLYTNTTLSKRDLGNYTSCNLWAMPTGMEYVYQAGHPFVNANQIYPATYNSSGYALLGTSLAQATPSGIAIYLDVNSFILIRNGIFPIGNYIAIVNGSSVDVSSLANTQILFSDPNNSAIGGFTTTKPSSGTGVYYTEMFVLTATGFIDLSKMAGSLTNSIVTPTNGNTGYKNFIINGNQTIAQRGTSFTNPVSGQYTLDRFVTNFDGTGGNRTISQVAVTPGELEGLGSSASYWRRHQRTSAGSGQTINDVLEKIEDCQRLAGKTVTLSFIAKAAANTALNLLMGQNYGTGGSTAVETSTQIATITTTAQKFSFTFSIPSSSGKTIGTNHYTYLSERYPLNSALYDVYITALQIELGSLATNFETRSQALELSLCQRYYEKSYDLNTVPGTIGAIAGRAILRSPTSDLSTSVPFKVTKRAAPAITSYNNSTGVANQIKDESAGPSYAFAVESIGVNGYTINISGIVGNNQYGWSWTADAEL